MLGAEVVVDTKARASAKELFLFSPSFCPVSACQST